MNRPLLAIARAMGPKTASITAAATDRAVIPSATSASASAAASATGSAAVWRWLDRTLGAGLMAALVMAALTALTAWPGEARAQRATGDGQAATEQRTLGEFKGVQTAQLRVVVRQGPVHQAVVHADRNLLPLLETVVQDGPQGATLLVRWKAGVSIKPATAPTVTVQAPQPERLSVLGSGDLIGEALKLTRLQASVQGSGDVRLTDVAVDELVLEVKGSGDVAASGQAGKLQARIAGSGDINTGKLRADDVAVAIAGSGDAVVDAQRTLAVSISGSGNVVHTGPAEPQKAINGSGSVRRR